MDESFLRNKYVTENLSAKDIAKLANYSKASIFKYLDEFKITKRESGKCIKKATCSYGMKYKLGHEVAHKRERHMISYIRKLSSQGLSNEKIAKVLTEDKYPTKTRVGKWHRKTVWEILNR